MSEKLIKDWVAESKTLKILVFGKTGAGKSSLINTLLGEVVAEEGEDIFSVTRDISSYDGVIPELTRTSNGIQVTLWDTPGLQDPDIEAEKILEEIERKCKGQVDLFIYCHDMTETRASQDDYDAISELTNALGKEIWNTAIIVLTFANRVRLPPSSGLEFKDYFEDRMKQWQQTLNKAVHKAGVPIEDTHEIPVVPASYRKIRLCYQEQDWFVTFWGTCMLRLRFESLPALIRMYHNEALDEVTKKELKTRIIVLKLKEIGDSITRREMEIANLPLSSRMISIMLFTAARAQTRIWQRYVNCYWLLRECFSPYIDDDIVYVRLKNIILMGALGGALLLGYYWFKR